MAQSTATVYINTKEGGNTLKSLASEAARLNAELRGTTLTVEEFAAKSKELATVEDTLKEQRKVLREYIDQYKQGTPVVEGSLNALKNKHTELLKELKELKQGTVEYNAKLHEVGEAAQEVGKVEAEIAKVSKTTKEATVSLLKVAGVMAAAFVADQLVSFGQNLGTAVIDYQKAASGLSAITGVTGDALADLESHADALTTIILENGKKITNEAKDILEGMKLVGSAQPELLKSADALSEVTKQAIILGRAAGQDLPSAVTDLTTVMNQFELPAKEAGRIINVLAAGAKEGAAEIPDISAAIKEFGAGAKSANVSVEESVALVETLGDKMIKGAEAGTALRNILLVVKAPEGLSKEAQEALKAHGVSFSILTDKSKTLAERLTELSKIQGDATAMVKVFGKENVTAGEIVLTNTARQKELTKAVTGTTEATKQAAIMSDNLGNDLKVMRDEASNAALKFGKELAPAARSLVQTFTDLLRGIKENWSTIVIFTKAVVTAAIAVGSYYGTVKILPAILDLWAKRQVVLTTIQAAWGTVMGVVSGQIAVATIAQRALNLVMSLNPVGLIISGLTALVGVYVMFSGELKKSYNAQELVKNSMTDFNKKLVEEKVKLEQTLMPLKDKTASLDEKRKAIAKLNELYPDILKKYNLEKGDLKELEKLENELTASIERRIATEMRDAQVADMIKEKLETQLQLNRLGQLQADGKTQVDEQGNDLMSGQIDILNEKISGLNGRIKAVGDEWSKVIGKGNGLDVAPKAKDNNATDGHAATKDEKKAEKAAEKAAKEIDKERAKLEKLKEMTVQYQNDIDQLNSDHDASEEIRIREKYAKQIALAEDLLKSKDPTIRKEAQEVIVRLTQEAEDEVFAMQNKHLQELEGSLKKHQEDVSALEQKDDEVKLTNIRQKYAKELDMLTLLEGSKKPEIAKKAAADKIALEAAMNVELLVETDKFNAEKAAKEDAALEKRLQERLKNRQDYLSFTGQEEPLELLNLELQYQKLIAATGLGEDQLTALKIANEKKRAAITAKYGKDRTDKEKAVTDKIKEAEYALQDARLNAYEKGIGIMRQFVGENTALGKALFAFEKAVAIARVIMEFQKQKAFIASAGAAMGPAGIPYITTATAAAAINAGVSIATIVATAIQDVKQKKSGGYNVRGADDGQLYNAQYIGSPRTGMLPPTPSLVLASEAGPEYYVSNAALTRPDVAWHVRMIDNIVSSGTVKQKVDGGYDRAIAPTGLMVQGSDPLLVSVLLQLNRILEQGIEANVSIGYRQIKDITTAQQRLQNNKG